ncbi:MAG: hypothetical protein ACXVB1_05635 [Pseudobdellovibrionaceae bacterium]
MIKMIQALLLNTLFFASSFALASSPTGLIDGIYRGTAKNLHSQDGVVSETLSDSCELWLDSQGYFGIKAEGVLFVLKNCAPSAGSEFYYNSFFSFNNLGLVQILNPVLNFNIKSSSLSADTIKYVAHMKNNYGAYNYNTTIKFTKDLLQIESLVSVKSLEGKEETNKYSVNLHLVSPLAKPSGSSLDSLLN